MESLRLHFIPNEIAWETKSDIKAIPSIARNNPFYHMTGGEDKITLELDWHAYDEERVSAINAANALKSWSKNDGYRRGLPRIKIICGSLFKNHIWIIQAAPYTMSLFQPNKGMLPAQVYQKLTLCKVTTINERRKTIANFMKNG